MQIWWSFRITAVQELKWHRAQTPENAALMCDSLRRQPFALSAVEVAQLFARMAQEQRRRGEPLLQLVSMQQGVAPLDT